MGRLEFSKLKKSLNLRKWEKKKIERKTRSDEDVIIF